MIDKRKKILTILIFIAVLFSTFAVLSGCSPEDSSWPPRALTKKITLTVHVDDETYKVDAYVGKEVSVAMQAITAKTGYYLTGYYDSESGGQMYFDSDGQSVSVWSKSYPTEFYAQWENVDNFVLANGVSWKDTYNYFGERYLSFHCTDGFKRSAIAGNRSRNVHITVSFKIQCPAYAGFGNDPNKDIDRALFITDKNNSAAEIYAKKYFTVHGLEYNEFSLDFTVSARVFTESSFNNKKSLAVYLKWLGSDYYPTYIKDVKISCYIMPNESGNM